MSLDKVEKILISEGVGKEWWKKGFSYGKETISIDCSIDSGLKKIEDFLEHEDLAIEVSSMSKKDDYMELTFYIREGM